MNAQEYFEALTVGGTRLRTTRPPSGAVYKGMAVGLEVEGVAKNNRYGAAVIGNHAQILMSQFIHTANGLAYMALIERTSPAASGAGAIQYQYWIAVYRTNPQNPSGDLAYCIVATLLSGRPDAADASALISLLPTWQVPAAQ